MFCPWFAQAVTGTKGGEHYKRNLTAKLTFSTHAHILPVFNRYNYMPVVTYYGHCNRSAQDVAYCSDWNYYASSFSGNIASVFCFYHLLLTKFLDNKNKKKTIFLEYCAHSWRVQRKCRDGEISCEFIFRLKNLFSLILFFNSSTKLEKET